MTNKPKQTPLNLKPMKAFSFAESDSVSTLMQQYRDTAFGARSLGKAADVFEAMVKEDTHVVLTLTGAMTMAGYGSLVTEMIERGWVDAVVSTGALVGHGLVQELGMTHYKADPTVDDETYYENRLNRVYDVIEPEDNLDAMEAQICTVLDQWAKEKKEPVGTVDLLKYLGQELKGAGILNSALKQDVPIYIPAFTDSELGLDFAIHMLRNQDKGEPHLTYSGFRDLWHYAEQCERALAEGKKLAIFTVGGGVPRNWAQQVGPYVDVRNKRLGKESDSVRFHYGIRICPDPAHYGHLSGCTYSEGVSWGKFVPESEGGKYAEVLMDATIGWPLILKAVEQRL